MTRRPPPISLRVRINERARELLFQLEHKDNQRSRVKWQATKALVAVHEMVSLMPPGDRDRCKKQCEGVQAFLEKIKDRGF